MDKNPGRLTRVAGWLLLPLVCAAMLPLALLFVLAMYLRTLWHAGVEIIATLSRPKKEPATEPLAGPHFHNVVITRVQQD